MRIKRGSARHNRAIGDGYAIYTGEEDFELPCQRSHEQKSHYTEIRLSDREHYIFRPFIANTQTIAGSCEGQVFFELIDGTQGGAQLDIVGSAIEYTVRSSSLPTTNNPATLPPSELTYALSPERGAFDPRSLRLTLADGRTYDIDVDQGITRIEDRNGNQLFFQNGGIYHDSGQGISFERDLQGRITRLIDLLGKTVDYAYDLNGDLVRVTNQRGDITRMTYEPALPHRRREPGRGRGHASRNALHGSPRGCIWKRRATR